MRALPVALAALVSLSGLVLVLSALQGCDEARPSLTVYGTLPAPPGYRTNPWPCIYTVAIVEEEELPPGVAGRYYPDELRIISTPAAFWHEVTYAVLLCEGVHDTDLQHASEVWRD